MKGSKRLRATEENAMDAQTETEAETDTFHLFGCNVRFLARSSETGGAYCLCEALVAPGAGAPLNRHAEDDEAFYVLDGEFAFAIGEETVRARPGDFVRVPRGAVHDFRNVGGRPARLLVHNTPGRVHDVFFSEAGRPMPKGARELPPPGPAPTPEQVARAIDVARRAGMEILPPRG